MRDKLWFAGATLLTIPSLVLRFSGMEAGPSLEASVYGIAIVGAAFLLTWGAEVAQVEISQSLALALLALVAILPEYAVDIYFAWTAASNPEYASYAAANMTGANRLLIGFGWVLVMVVFWAKTRQKTLVLEENHSIELFFLVLATLYSFTIPIKGYLHIVDGIILLTLFGLYFWSASRAGVEEPQLGGPAALVGGLSRWWRRGATLLLFVYSALIILLAAKPFADGLVITGKSLGVDEFLLVQWIAPLASEAPELSVAAIFALRGFASAGFGALLSSKVNQWTLLVGALPLAYAVSAGGVGGLPLDARQVEEVLLTGAQSAFAIVLLARLRFSLAGALVLLVLFGSQLFLTSTLVRYGYSGAYLALALGLLLADRGRLRGLVRMGRSALGRASLAPEK